jgi:hypothetical protein
MCGYCFFLQRTSKAQKTANPKKKKMLNAILHARISKAAMTKQQVTACGKQKVKRLWRK